MKLLRIAAAAATAWLSLSLAHAQNKNYTVEVIREDSMVDCSAKYANGRGDLIVTQGNTWPVDWLVYSSVGTPVLRNPSLNRSLLQINTASTLLQSGVGGGIGNPSSLPGLLVNSAGTVTPLTIPANFFDIIPFAMTDNNEVLVSIWLNPTSPYAGKSYCAGIWRSPTDIEIIYGFAAANDTSGGQWDATLAAINNQQHVVGLSKGAAPGSFSGFLYRNTIMTNLAT